MSFLLLLMSIALFHHDSESVMSYGLKESNAGFQSSAESFMAYVHLPADGGKQENFNNEIQPGHHE